MIALASVVLPPPFGPVMTMNFPSSTVRSICLRMSTVPLSADAAKKIDHVAYDSTDIETDYKKAVDEGYKITTNGIEGIPTVFDNGVRYFKIQGPSGEEVEFCQIL